MFDTDVVLAVIQTKFGHFDEPAKYSLDSQVPYCAEQGTSPHGNILK